jgi:O-succinylbenzoic acid--CoA ligase
VIYNGVIHVNNVTLTGQQVTHKNFDFDAFPQPLAIALEFINLWLKGKQLFEIKTSGSTGKPKVVSISRRQMELSAQNTINALGINADDTALVTMDTKFIGGKMMIVRALEARMDMVIQEPSANPFRYLPDDLKVDFTALVPLQIQASIDHDPEKLNQIKYILIGGASLLPDMEVKIQELKPTVYHTFGMTETVSHIALRRLNGINKSDLYTAFENVDLSLDERGCLRIKSEITNNLEVISNDIVEIINPKQFKWLGRVDNVINSGGVKIQIEELEQQLGALIDKNLRFFVYGIPDKKLGEKAVLLIESEPLPLGSHEKILMSLKGVEPKYYGPREVLYLPRFIYSETGKIMRKESIAVLNA